MAASKRYRSKTVSWTAKQRRDYKAKADRVDREERSAITAQARRAKARMNMLRSVVDDLKAERESQGLSLTDVSRLSGIDKAALSRLENAANVNPKLDTLVRYADALGVKLQLSIDGKAA